MPLPAEPPVPTPPELLICPLDAGRLPTGYYRGLLSADERRRVDALRRPEARRRSLVARALLRLELATRLDCRPEAVAFTLGAQGKPGLADGGAWHFNLSHSGERIVLALAPGAPVGVDIESSHRRSRIDALARHYFGRDEQAELAALDPHARRAHFFRLWTLKEAVTKALGRSLWTTLAGIRVSGDAPDGPQLRLEGDAHCDTPLGWWCWQPDEHYSLALVHLDPMPVAPAVFRSVPGQWREPWPLAVSLSGTHAPASARATATRPLLR